MRATVTAFLLLLALLILVPGQARAADQERGHGLRERMAKLEELQKSDPAQFKAETQKISDNLAQKAKETQDARKSQRLTAMSQKFAEAARTGEMTPLRRQGRADGANEGQYGHMRQKKQNQDQSNQ